MKQERCSDLHSKNTAREKYFMNNWIKASGHPWEKYWQNTVEKWNRSISSIRFEPTFGPKNASHWGNTALPIIKIDSVIRIKHEFYWKYDWWDRVARILFLINQLQNIFRIGLDTVLPTLIHNLTDTIKNNYLAT
jgi:hypothetical protein